MPRPIYSTLFVAETVGTSGPYPGIIPNLGEIAVVRDIVAWTAASGIGNRLVANMQPVEGTVLEWNNLAAGDNNPHWSGRMVLTPEFYLIFQATAGNWNLAVSGYILSNP